MSTSYKDNQGHDFITDPSIVKLFERRNFAFLATLMKDNGSPEITLTWIHIWVDIDKNNNTILVDTVKGKIKQTTVSRHPLVAVSVIDFLNPSHIATVRGKVIEQINGKEAVDHIDRLAKKHLGKDKYPGLAPGKECLLLRIKPLMRSM